MYNSRTSISKRVIIASFNIAKSCLSFIHAINRRNRSFVFSFSQVVCAFLYGVSWTNKGPFSQTMNTFWLSHASLSSHRVRSKLQRMFARTRRISWVARLSPVSHIRFQIDFKLTFSQGSFWHRSWTVAELASCHPQTLPSILTTNVRE